MLKPENPILLSYWLEICDRSQINYIPANYGPRVKIDEIYRFNEGFDGFPSLDKAYQWLRQYYQPYVNIWRWDCCSPEALKLVMADGYTNSPPLLKFDLDDARFILVLEELEKRGETEVSILIRPWIRAKVENKYPVEFRSFKFPEGIAVSSYYTRRSLPSEYEQTAISVRTMTEKLARYSSLNNFSADFLLTEENKLLFLEGGLGLERNGLVNSCCFDSNPKPGSIALKKFDAQ